MNWNFNRFAFRSIFALLSFFATTAFGQWVPINGQGGNSILCFNRNSTYLFAGTNAGLLRSSDNGLSWLRIGNGITRDSILSVASLDSYIFAGTWGGVFRSIDNGDSWTLWNKGIHVGQYSTKVMTFATMGNYLFAGTESGVYRFSKGDSTWVSMNDGNTGIAEGISLLTANGDSLYCYSDQPGGISWLSVDSGKSWAYHISPYSTYIKFGSDIFATFRNQRGPMDTVYRSSDNGRTWVNASAGLALQYGVSGYAVCGQNLFATTLYGGLYVTTDRGATWIPRSNGLPLASQPSSLGIFDTVMFIVDKPETVGAGIYRSSDYGVSWTNVNYSIPRGSMSKLENTDRYLFSGPLRSSDLGLHWYVTSPPIYAITRMGNVLFATDSVVVQSTDQGTTWSRSVKAPYTNCLASMGTQLFSGSKSVERSTDSGNTWNDAGGDIYTGVQQETIVSLAACGTTLYAGTELHGLYRSTDSGASWKSIVQYWNNGEIHSLVGQGSTIYTGLLGNLRYSTDTGNDWSTRPGDLEGQYVYSILPYGANIFIATQRGVLLSKDENSAWTSVSDSLMSGAGSLLIADGCLCVGTLDNGVWRRPLSEMIGQNSGVSAPHTESAIQAYPNPVSNEITFSLNANTESDIRIVDLLGIELSHAHIKSNMAHIDCSNLTNGRYITVIRENNTVQTIPILVQH